MRPLTHSCFLLLAPREALLACRPCFLLEICFPSVWNPPFPLHALTSIPLFLTKVRLSLTLTLSHHAIWYSELTALFLLTKAARAYLPTALSVASRPLFPFQQAQYVQVFPLKPAPFCTLFAGLGSTNKSDSRPTSSLLFSCLTLALSSPPCPSPPSFFLPQTLWQIQQELSCFSSCSIRLQWVPGHSFLPGNDVVDELARQGVLLVPGFPWSWKILEKITFLVSHAKVMKFC